MDESFRKATETENKDEYVSFVPKIENLEKDLQKMAETILTAKEDIDTVNSENKRMLTDIKNLFNRTKQLESKVNASQKELVSMEKSVNKINGFVV